MECLENGSVLVQNKNFAFFDPMVSNFDLIYGAVFGKDCKEEFSRIYCKEEMYKVQLDGDVGGINDLPFLKRTLRKK